MADAPEVFVPDDISPADGFQHKDALRRELSPDAVSPENETSNHDRVTVHSPVSNAGATHSPARNEKEMVSTSAANAQAGPPAYRLSGDMEVVKAEGQSNSRQIDPPRPITVVPDNTDHIRPRIVENTTNWNTPFLDFCDPVDLAMESIFCPCILGGRTRTRLRGNPTLQNYTTCNPYCTSWFLGTLPLIVGVPLYAIMGMTMRRDVRKQYGIEGSGCVDCAISTFCCWCGLVQEEKEVVSRTEIAGRTNAKTYETGYVAANNGGEMKYPSTP